MKNIRDGYAKENSRSSGPLTLNGQTLPLLPAFAPKEKEGRKMSEKKRRLPAGGGAGSSTAKKPKLPTTTKTSAHAHSLRNKLKSDAEILASLQKLHAECQAAAASSKNLTLTDLNLAYSCREVTDLDPNSVTHSIERCVLEIAKSILSGNGFSFDVPSRSATNQMYVRELDRIVLREKSSARPFASLSTVRKATVTARVLSLVYGVLQRNIHVTKRDLFYTDVKLFQVRSFS